ncbi:MAG: DUF924 domain-containing protein [Sphingomonadales bacterium]|nr:DUF924 domain-containing protein [Sphingomonadales bacterium]
MAAARRTWAADLLHFWFDTLGPRDWFGSGPSIDAALRRRFGRRLLAMRRLPASAFLTDPLTARAAILLFDHCPRNLYRQDRSSFATDPLARAITCGALRRGWDKGLAVHEAQFLLMPLMHSESRRDQRESLRRFTALGDAGIIRFARTHAAMVLRFGRFPHRNAVLGRHSSAAEIRAVAAGNHW